MLRRLFKQGASPAKIAAPKDPHPPSNHAVTVVNVGKKYGEFWAVRGVTFALSRGECLGIVGLNGAGKSTLLQMIAGSIPPSEGTVEANGRIVALLELGATFNDDFTGVENLHLAASMLGMHRRVVDENLPEIEAFAEIGDFIRKPMRTYSSGMRVRLAFALLTQVKPDIMIVDEALSVGDAYFSHKCVRLLQRFRSEGRSLLFVSHDPSAVKTFCDRALLLDHGVVAREGRPADVLDYYNAMIAVKEREHEIRVAEAADGVRRTRSGDQRAVLERFDLLDSAGRSVRAITCGSRVCIVCVVEFREAISSPTVGFLIRDRLGNDVFGTNTFNLGFKTGTYGLGERMEIEFEAQLNLGPGNYSLTLAVHAGSDHREGNHDWWDNLLAFSIVPEWPFVFTGVAALPATARYSDRFETLGRSCGWDEALRFTDTGNAHRFQLTGWAAPEGTHCWAQGPEARLAVRLPDNQAAVLYADVFPFLSRTVPEQCVQLGMGDKLIQEWRISQPTLLEAHVPPIPEPHGEMRLWWRFPNACSPAAAGMSTDRRELAVAFREIRFSPAPKSSK